MSKGEFKYIKQQKPCSCGYACLEMVAGIPPKVAEDEKDYIETDPNLGLKINEMGRILRIKGDGTIKFKLRGDKLKIGNGISVKKLGKLFKKRIGESESSLLIFLVKKEEGSALVRHWILYDVGDSQIKDPDQKIGKPIAVDDYILSEIGKIREFRFYPILRDTS